MNRNNSKFINMRKFHGYVKKNIIKTTVNNTTDVSYPKDLVLLDVSIGRFGDLHNYYSEGIRKVIGIDPDTDSIKEANKRIANTNYKDMFCKLYVDTITNEKILLTKTIKYHIITCNFTLHYFFQTEKHLTNALKNISDRLHIGYYFIGTTICDTENVVPNDDLFFEKGSNFYDDTLFGREYIFELLDNKNSGNYFDKARASKPEFRVSITTFVEYAKKFGLVLVSMTSFKDIPYDRTLFSPTELYVSNLYTTFVFVKQN